MGRLSRNLLVLAVGAAAAVALASCGSSASPKLLPGATASQINSNLDQVQRLVSENECIGAENAAAEISNQVNELSGVDKKLKQALSEGAQRLNEVVAGCEEEVAEESTEATETGEETEPAEKNEKAEKEKAKSEKEPKEPKEPPVKPPEPPAHEEGGGNEGPPVETGGGTPSGGIGPGAPAGAG